MGKQSNSSTQIETDLEVTSSPPDTRSVDTIFEHLHESVNALADARHFHRQFRLGNITSIPEHLVDIAAIGNSVIANTSAFVAAVSAISSGASPDPAD